MHRTILHTAKGAWVSEEYDRYKRAQAARWLEYVGKIRSECDSLEDSIQAAHDRATGLSGMDYSMPAVSSSPSSDAIPNSVIRMQSMVSDLCARLGELVEEQQAAEAALSCMQDVAGREALRRHYLNGQTWESTCVAMAYTYDGMMTLRRRALVELYDHMPTKWRDPVHPAI